MTSLPSVLFLLLAISTPVRSQASAAQADCQTWQECRDAALAARDAGDYERFHDLAWRAMQTRKQLDPELMYILARAQSLSGRPGDALVMLRRLAELDVAYDALTHEDLARVRNLPGWRETRALLEAAGTASSSKAEAPGEGVDPSPRESEPGKAPPAGKEVKAAPAPAAATTAAEIGKPLARFASGRFVPGGFAYDAVSKRFIVGNLPARKLTVIGEGTNRAATLAGSDAALFDVRAIAIDRHEGDLWVASADCKPGSPAADCRSALHKLQLISGRVLSVFDPPEDGARPLDVAVVPGGVLVLDANGPRLLKASNSKRSGDGPTSAKDPRATLAVAVDLPPGEAMSLAASPDGSVAYVAYRDRLLLVQLKTGAATPLAGPKGRSLGGFERLRWSRGALVGLQAQSDDEHALVRLALVRNGSRVRTVEPMDAPVERDMRAVGLDVVNGELYYLLAGGEADNEAAIRAVRLK